MNYLGFLVKKAEYVKGNYMLDSESSGWISPTGIIYFLDNPDQEHSDVLMEIHDAGEYTPSERAFKEVTVGREEKDYRDENGGIFPDYFVAMGMADGWIRFFGGEDGRWAGIEGAVVNFECYNFEVLKKLHKFIKQEKVRIRSPKIWVEVEKINYNFTGSKEEFLEDGLRRKQYASRKRKADVGDYWYIHNKLYDASEEGHAQIIQKYLENDPNIDPEELEFMYNSNQHFRDYALNKLNGIRIAQDQVEVGSLDASKLDKIRKAFVQIYDEDAYSMKIGIQDNKTKTYYFNVPMEEVDGDFLKSLRRYKMYSGKKNMNYLSVLVKKADFEGMDYQITEGSEISSENSGWLSPEGDIYLTNGSEHDRVLGELIMEYVYQPSGKARDSVINEKYGGYEDAEFEMEDDSAMAFIDGWIRYFGGQDNRWQGLKGNVVNFECEDFNSVKKLHSKLPRLLNPSVSKILVETRQGGYLFQGTPEEFYSEGLRRKQYAKKADFSGDFQNIYDIRPDPGNAYPGRNREYVKQQTDYFPHKVSVDGDEFTHTHPEHCPRYDLRKLKVVDDPDESESEFSNPEKDK
jgi:hypothetical protein